MALDDKVGDILNAQINKELYSAYLYLTFADYYEDRRLRRLGRLRRGLRHRGG